MAIGRYRRSAGWPAPLAMMALVTEIMPDRCTPEYERVLGKLGALPPYRRARALLEDVFPIAEPPAIDTIQQRTLGVGARLAREAIAAPRSAPAEDAEAITLSIDSGHVRAVRGYQVRTFEVFVARVSNDEGQQITFGGVRRSDRSCTRLVSSRDANSTRCLNRSLGRLRRKSTDASRVGDGPAQVAFRSLFRQVL